MQASTQDDQRSGRNSPSLNRLASLSDLNSVKKDENTTMYIGDSRKYINYETVPGFVDQDISKINNRSANIIGAPERHQRAAKYLQLTNKLPQPRSNSTMIGQLKKNVKPVMDGSFIMLDENSSRAKLSEIIHSRNQSGVPGLSKKTDIVKSRARFEQNF